MLDCFQAVIFDLDGVIIDSEPLHERAKREVFARHALDVPDELYDAFFKGKTDRDVITHVVETYGDGTLEVDVLIDEKHEAYRERVHAMETVPGALDVIRRLHEGGVRLGLVTSAVPENQLLAFEQFGLDAYFEEIVTAADVTHAKPHPEPYALAAERMGVDPARCLVIEDAVNGVKSARAAGCTIAALTTSLGVEALSEAGADYVAVGYDELWAKVADRLPEGEHL